MEKNERDPKKLHKNSSFYKIHFWYDRETSKADRQTNHFNGLGYSSFSSIITQSLGNTDVAI